MRKRCAARSFAVLALTVSMTTLGFTTSNAPMATAASPGKEVLLDFDGAPVERQSGTSSVTIRRLTAAGGTITATPGPKGGGGAVRLPAYREGTSPKAAFSIVPEGETDPIEPRKADFRFGSDFTLNKVSTGSKEDDGNNLVQRGLYNHSAQMKLQVDEGRPSCRLKGSGGIVLLRSEHKVAPGEWYRTWCRRHGDKATLQVVRLSDKASWTKTVTRRLGGFWYAQSTPFSAGAKLAGPRQFVSGSADQFNGRIDRVFLDIG